MNRSPGIAEPDLDRALRVRLRLPLVVLALLVVVGAVGVTARVPVLVPLPVVSAAGGELVVALTDEVPESFGSGGTVRVVIQDGTWRSGTLVPSESAQPDGPLLAVVRMDEAGQPGAGTGVLADLGTRPLLWEVIGT